VNQDASVRDDLKKVIRGHLGKAASSLFIEKSLAILEESADNKESFMAAAVRISRRIALFIDRDLAQTVYESLMAAIEKIAAPQGTRRRYRRVAFCRKIRVGCDGEHHELDSENLSEGGMYIRTRDPFPAGSELEIALPMGAGNRLNLRGVVVYKSDPFGDTSKLPPGMAVEFREIGDKEAGVLRSYIQKIHTQEVFESKSL
jgi:Tfp pilus assembly protein PilZ